MRFNISTLFRSQSAVFTGLILASYALILFCLPEPIIALHKRWTQFDGAYSHGYLLVIVCGYLVVKPLPGMIEATKPKPLLAFFIFLPSLLWAFGYATQVNVFQQLAYPMFLAALLLPFVGFKGLVRIGFPLGLMFLAIPIWEVLLPPLREMTSIVATSGVRLLGIPAHIDGFSFTLPYGVVLIAGSCAGLSYFLMGIVLAGINAQYRSFSLKHTLLSVGLMALLAIIGNWIRVYALILIAYYSKMQSALVYDHGNFGWWIFAAIFTLYLFIIRGFPETEFAKNPISHTSIKGGTRFSATLSLLVFLALTMPLLFKLSANQSVNLDQFQVESQSLKGLSVQQGRSSFKPSYSNFDLESYWQGSLEGGQWTIGRFVYAKQAQGKELIGDSNKLTRDRIIFTEGWQFDEYEFLLNVIASEQRLVLSTNIVGNRTNTGNLATKISQFTESVQGRPAVALWFASTQCESTNCVNEIELVKRNARSIKMWLGDLALYTPAR